MSLIYSPSNRFNQVAKRAEDIKTKLDAKEEAKKHNGDADSSASKPSTSDTNVESVASDTCDFLSNMAGDEKRNKERLGRMTPNGAMSKKGGGSSVKLKLKVGSPKKGTSPKKSASPTKDIRRSRYVYVRRLVRRTKGNE